MIQNESPPLANADEAGLNWQTLVTAVSRDHGSASRDHLEAGRPVYYTERNTPRGLLIKKHPDGRRELIRLDVAGGVEVVVTTLA